MNAILKPPAAHMHPDEWRERVQLAACYRVFDPVSYTHLTLPTNREV